MFAQGCVCLSVYAGEYAVENREVCVCRINERRKGIRTNPSSVFNMVSEHKCSNSGRTDAAYVNSPAH